MNRIYQGKVTNVQIANPDKHAPPAHRWVAFDPDPNQAKAKWQSALWQHHQLFQDAVNYYIVALAAMGSSPESKLTQLRELLKTVWESFDKKGQRRQGMGESLQRAWEMSETPTLAEAVERFRKPMKEDGVPLTTAETAAEYLLFKLGGDASIRDNGPVYFPMFCSADCESTFRLSPTALGRAADEARLRKQLHQDLTRTEIRQLAESISLASVVYLQPNTAPDSGEAVRARLREAAKTFENSLEPGKMDEWLGGVDNGFSLPKSRGGNINIKRVHACMLFLAFPNAVTKKLFQSTFPAPRSKKNAAKSNGQGDDSKDESRFVVNGDDPIKLARGTRGNVFPGFTSLPLWNGDGRRLSWKEFDIAAFKEALKVYNQFQQNLEKREERLNGLALKLLVMDAERVAESYSDGSELERGIRGRLAKLWQNSKGKPKPPASEAGEEATLPRFSGDPRIERLRRIVNDDLAEEYRLTDGRRTPYGLRRRTMKGWSDVKRRWQQIVKAGDTFSEEKRRKLKENLDELRGGEKREQIGSHGLFEALIADEEAWLIWRESDDEFQEQINKNDWPADPLEAFREYCEIREALEEISGRPLNFTPADARYSRRLFTFTDVCSFGKKSGEFRHDAEALAVTVPVALRGADGKFAVQPCRLMYSAPRLLRDRIRAEGGAYIQDWTQPMMRALFDESDERANPQELKEAAVQLMPDYDSKRDRRVLLNFPLRLMTSSCWERVYAQRGQKEVFGVRFSKKDKKKEDPVNGGLWESNLRTFWENDRPKKRDVLYWPDDERRQLEWSKGEWWEKVSSFRVLAADLGTRHAASIAIVECGANRESCSVPIGSAGGEDWFARYRSGVILRLPGENAKVLRPESPLDKDGLGKAFREEVYGERGRPADKAECEETFTMLSALNQSELLREVPDMDSLKQRFSLPEQNDKLLVALRRTQNWIATCVSWHWKLTHPDSEQQRQSALEQIREQERMRVWRDLADGKESRLAELRDVLHRHISEQRQLAQQQLLRLTGRILPLRRSVWEWVPHPEKPDCHLLRQTPEGTGQEKAKLRGQRGLSMARIEQLSELRRRWQSLNQSLRRRIGEKPLTASEMRNDPIPDPCPDILNKLENIREQRVNQTAHLILAQALGLRLRQPEISAKSRRVADIHGEYELVRPPVDMIVVEDLARYLSDQGRAKSENTRLMKWCHRAITLKLKMLAEPFGIPILETPAAYSSRFCSLSGVAGFRAAEVSWNDRHKFRWRVLLQEDAAARAENKKPSPNAAHAANLFARLKTISISDAPNRTLLAPQSDGPIFVTAKPIPHPAPAPNRKQSGNNAILPMQADLNAAVNLALRAVAHPAAANIHHRLRTERRKGTKNQADAFLAREPRRFGKDKVSIFIREGDSLPKERNTNLFYDKYRIAPFGRARLETDANGEFVYASGPGVWKTVNDREKQWERCMAINKVRLREWDDLVF